MGPRFSGVTFANMRRHVLLHKLIVIEVSTFAR
jgi:hypothetical protein